MNSITPLTLQSKIASGGPLRLVDVRTPAESAALHLPRAILKPLESLDPAALVNEWKDQPGETFVICQSGTRARTAIRKLEAAGARDCVLVEGGVAACAEAGLVVERRAAGAISLERQVRIAAGTLVLAGAIPGLLVHPAFLALPIFVGAGLVFAGVSDICGMGMLLAKMPWNQSTGCATVCEPK